MTAKTWIQGTLLLVGLGGILACDKTPPPPPTYPVTGKVVFLEGGSPADGMIEFRSAGAESISARGKVDANGAFTLSCIVNNKTLEGTVEGEHTVMYMPGQGGDKSGQSNLLPSSATEKYKVKADGKNELTIKLAKPKAP